MAPGNIDASAPATVSQRLLAFQLDWVASVLLAGIVGLCLGAMDPGSNQEALLGLFTILFFFLYHAVGVALFGRTLGKWVAGVRVTVWPGASAREQSSSVTPSFLTRPSLARSVVRAFGYVVSAMVLGLGFAWSLFNPGRRCWHDYLAGTHVVQARQDGLIARFAISAGAWLLLLGLLAGVVFRLAGPAALGELYRAH